MERDGSPKGLMNLHLGTENFRVGLTRSSVKRMLLEKSKSELEIWIESHSHWWKMGSMKTAESGHQSLFLTGWDYYYYSVEETEVQRN